MRDIALMIVVFGAIPFMLRRPWLGILMWAWLSLMNPHRLTWGIAYSMPFAQVTALAVMLGILFTRDPERKFPVTGITVLLSLLFGWMCVTTVMALEPASAQEMWSRVMKIQLMNFMAMYVLHSRSHIQLLIWVMVGSLGFYGIKGGLFTLLSGGEYRVWGPAMTFIEENNSLALAVTMTIPLMYYAYQQATRLWLKLGIVGVMVLSGFAVLGSHSRGGLLAIAGMVGFLWLKSSHKLATGIVLALLVPVMIGFMPDNWRERMDTITQYEQDRSAMGRINTWMMAINLTKDRPLVGGGFEMYSESTFARWAPDPLDIHTAHSIYFQMLGEHGYPGLILFLIVWLLAWRSARWIIVQTRDKPKLRWASDFARAGQVSMVGYLVGGAFLNLGYFDLPYFLITCIVLARVLVDRELRAQYPAPVRDATGTLIRRPQDARVSPQIERG